MKACFFTTNPENRLRFVFDGRQKEFEKRLELLPEPVLLSEMEEKRAQLAEVEVILSTWGMPALTEAQVREFFPKLRLVLYSAASVRYFAEGYLDAGVTEVTAAQAMADFVTQYTVAAIYHLNKGFYRSAELYRSGRFDEGKAYSQFHCPGNYETKIGVIGAGAIGSRVIRQLNAYPFEILLFDPFVSNARATELKAKKVSLETLFAESDVISNHLANNPQTVDMLNYALFSRMKPDAAFINTGRGAQVVETDLARALREEPGRWALLDVTREEPIAPEHEFWALPNLTLTPHIAGVGRLEVLAYDDLLLDELDRWLAGLPLRHAVSKEQLKTMA